MESYWRIGSVDGDVASLRDLIDVLVNVTDFRFSGSFTDVSETILFEFMT